MKKTKGTKSENPNHLKVLEFSPRDEEEPDDFGDILHDIINASKEENESYYNISYAKKGIVLAWDDKDDRMLAQIHNMTNMEINFLLQRLILNLHFEFES
jgi:hypothetical protein